MQVHSSPENKSLNAEHSNVPAPPYALQHSALEYLNESLQMLSNNHATSQTKELDSLASAVRNEVIRYTREHQQMENYISTLERVNAELDQFAFIVSHDLKAPLRAISNLAGWISEDCESGLPESSKEHLELLRKRINGMEKLIKGILGYSKSGMTDDETLTDAAILVNDIIDTLQAPGHITITMSGEFAVLSTQATKLRQVITNLLSNAVNYNDKDQGRINVHSEVHDDYCRFIIEDNGMGIRKENLENIFTIFNTVSTQNENSTGIGLAIVRKLVEENKGIIHAESEYGNGSRFIFTWPCRHILKNVKQ